MASSPVYVGTPKLGLVQIVAADASALKTLATAGASGSKLVGVTICSDDSSARVVQLYITRSGVDYLIATVNVPTLSGTDGTNAVVSALGQLLPGLPIDNDGQRYLFMENGDVLKAKTTTTVTAAK